MSTEEKKPLELVPLCKCRQGDAWRCAVFQGLRTLSCPCPCHKPITAS